MGLTFLQRGWRAFTLALAALTAAYIGPVSASERAWQANEDDALLFDLRLGNYRLGEGVRGYQTPQSVCINFADLIGSFDLAIKLDETKATAKGWAFEEARTIDIDRVANRLLIQGNKRELPSGAIVDTPEGWCVDTAEASRWMGVELTPDLANAVILVKSAQKLPVERAMERKSRAGACGAACKIDPHSGVIGV